MQIHIHVHIHTLPGLISGSISLNEMAEVLETLYSMESIDKVTYKWKRKVKLTNLQNDILERAESLFQLLDDTLDGEVDEEEFVR